jgi:regulator of cell morphogenesis and NO signaling
MGSLASPEYGVATLGDIVAADTHAALVLDRFGLDFCCHGHDTLDAACREHHIDPSVVVGELMAIKPAPEEHPAADASWPLGKLTRYLEGHHASLRDMLPLIGARLHAIAPLHLTRYPELTTVSGRFDALAANVRSHMLEEESVLFPRIRALIGAFTLGMPSAAWNHGTVRHMVAVLEADHGQFAGELHELRQRASGYQVPPDASASHQVALHELAEFDRDLRMHMHLENNVVFPRAVALEDAGD